MEPLATCAEVPCGGPGSATPVALARMCAFCSTELAAVSKMCGGCRSVFYCGRHCQKKNWSLHRHACNRLCIIVRFISGHAQAFPGFKYDQLTFVLEEQILEWLAANRAMDVVCKEVTLINGERVLDKHKTFRGNELTDGMEITATVVREPEPPGLTDASDSEDPFWYAPQHISDSASESSDSQGSDFFVMLRPFPT